MDTKYNVERFEEKVLAEIFASLSFSISLDIVLSEILEQLRRLFNCDAGYIFIYNEAKESLRLTAVAGNHERRIGNWLNPLPDIERNLGDGIEGWVARERAPLFVQHLESDPRYVPIGNDWPIKGVISVPLESGVQLAGVLTLSSDNILESRPEEINILSHVGSRLAEFILEAVSRKQLEERVQELAFLMRIINLADASGHDTRKFLRALEIELPRFFPLFTSRLHLLNTSDPRSYCTLVQEGHGLIPSCPAIAKKIPLIVNDTNLPISCKAVKNPLTSALTCIPLSADKNAHGILQMESDKVGAFPGEQVEFFMAMGNEIASALEKARVRSHLEERIKELSGVYEAAAFELAILSSGASDPNELLIEASHLIKRLINIDKVFIFLVEKINNELFLTEVSKSEKRIVEKVGDGIAGWVAKHGKPWNSSDIFKDAEPSSIAYYAAGMRSILSVPMMVGKRRIGVVIVGTTTIHEFVPSDVKLLLLIASRAAIAVENAQLQAAEANRRAELLAKHKALKKQSDDLAKANKNLSILYELHQTLGSTLELQPLLERVLEQIATVVEAPLNAITVHLVDADRERLDLVAQRGVPASLLPKYQLHFDDLPSGKLTRLLKEQRAIILHDLSQDIEMRSLVRGRVRSFYAIPLIAQDRMQGVLTLAGARRRAVSQEKLELLRAISNQLAVSIENARLYQASRRFAELNRFVSTVRSLLNLDDRLHQIVKNSASLLSQEFAVIALIEDGKLLRIRAYIGLPYELTLDDILHLDPKMEQAIIEGKLIVIPECRHESYSPIPFDLKERNGSLLIAPLKVKDKVLGILMLGSFHPVQYAREEIEFITLVANQMGVAVENSILYQNAVMERNTLEAIVKGMGDGVVTIDLEGRITSFNESAERLTCFNKNEVFGKPVQEVFRVESGDAPIYLPSYSDFTDKALQLGVEKEGVIYQCSSKHGASLAECSKKDVSSIHTLLVNENKEPAGWVVVFRDITKEKQLAQAKNDFVAMASHDLRTPLTAIKGYAVTLLRHDKRFDDTTQKEFLKVINSEIDRLSRLLDNLLNLSRLEAGRLEVRKDMVDFYEIARKTVDVFKVSATKHEFAIDIPSDCSHVYADQDRLEQILNNLISNAIKYSPAGGTITINSRINGKEWIASVSDQGTGIPKEQLAFLFERFHRVESKLTRHVSGTGLGLFITRSLVEAHGGQIWVESEIGHGTTFYFALPIENQE